MDYPMARPSKAEENRRSTILKVRVTPGEYDTLKRDATRAGQTVSEITRRKVLNTSVTVRTTRSLPVEAYTELKKIGVNLNQMARRMNATGRVDEVDIQIVRKEIDRLMNLLSDQNEPGAR
jgi:hypothetical protein